MVCPTLALCGWPIPAAVAVHTVSAGDEASSWLLWVVTLVIGGGLAAIMFKNAKRTHRD